MGERMAADYNTDSVKDQEIPFYSQFEQWYVNISGLFDYGQSSIRYDPREKKFYQYYAPHGYYRPIFEEFVLQLFNLFADASTIELEPKHYAIFNKRFRAWAVILFTGEWNMEGFENLEDCVMDLTMLEELPHDPKYMFRYYVPRKYVLDPDRMAVRIFQNLLKTGTKGALTEQFLVNLVHRDFSQKMFLLVYGKAGGGKSTLLNIPANLFGDELTSTTDLYHLGKRFGLADMYDKRVNIDSDLPVKMMGANVVSTIKKLTGGVKGSDNKITIEKKGVDPFSVRVQSALIFGCNQLPKWDDESLTECESIGRRVLLNKYETFQIDCPGLEEITIDPEFLDNIYSYLIQQPVKPINTIGKEKWIKESLTEWFENCDPLLGILKELYKATEDESDSVPCSEVFEQVRVVLIEENSIIPKNLMAQITQSLMALGIKKNTTKNKPKYLKIKRLYLDVSTEEKTKPKTWYDKILEE